MISLSWYHLFSLTLPAKQMDFGLIRIRRMNGVRLYPAAVTGEPVAT